MRPSLPTRVPRRHPSETRRGGRRRGRLLSEPRDGARGGFPRAELPETAQIAEAIRGAGVLAPSPDAATSPDAAARRVREAGGPLDEATYTCRCGCLFAAAVTTSVACPHCGGEQAW